MILNTEQVSASGWDDWGGYSGDIYIYDPVVNERVAEKVGHGGPYQQYELDRITSISVGGYYDEQRRDYIYADNLNDLLKLSNLSDVSITSDKITSLGPLSSLPIKYLSISSSGIDDLSPLIDLNLDSISISGTNITSLYGLNLNSSVTSVSIYNNRKLTDVSKLSNFPNLKDFSLYGNDISDISFLYKIHSVDNLDLSGNEITDISPISRFDSIDSLNLSSNPLKTDDNLEPLNLIDTIGTLKIEQIGANEDNEFDFLGNRYQSGRLTQPKIKSLYVGNNRLPRATKLMQKISTNSSIENLYLNSCALNTFEDFKPITGRRFKEIDLSHNSLNSQQSKSSLKELGDMNINKLNLDYNNLSDNTLIKSISEIDNLKTLTLNNNEFTNFTTLKELSGSSSLSDIEIRYNKFTNTNDLHLIDNSGELNIDLRYNKISNVDIKNDNNSIKTLNLSNNEISTINNVDKLKKLTDFTADYNKVKDFSAFKNITAKVVAQNQTLPTKTVKGSYFEYPIKDNKGELVRLKSQYFKDLNNGYKFISLPGSSLSLSASKYDISWSIPLNTSGVKLTTGAEDFSFATTGVKTKEDFVTEDQLKNSVKNLPGDAYITIINNPTRSKYIPEIEELETRRTRIIDTTNAIKNKDNTKIKNIISQNKVDFNTSGNQTDKLDITRVSEKSESTIKITFGDGSAKEYKIPVTYEENTKTYDVPVNILPLESDLFVADTHKIISTITKPVDIKTGLDTKLPDGAVVEIYEDVDVNTLGNQVGKIKIKFADNSEKIINIDVEIIDWLKNTFKPNIEPEKVIVGDKIDITNNILNIPEGSEVTDITNPAVDKDKLQETTGMVHVKFPDGSEINYEVPIVIYNVCDNTSALKEKIQDLLKEIERLNNLIKENEKTIQELKEKNLTNKDEYEKIIKQLNDKLKEANDKITELQKEIQQLKEEIERLKLENKILDSENKELKAQVVLLERLLKESQADNIKRAEEVVRLKTQIEVLEKENKEKTEKITELESIIKEKDNIIERETKVIEDKTSEIERLKSILLEKEKRIEELEGQSEKDKDLINKLKAEIERLKSEIEKLTKELNESKELVKKLTEELNLLKEKYKELQNKYSSSLSQLEEKDNIIKDLLTYKNIYEFQSSGGSPDYTNTDKESEVKERTTKSVSDTNNTIHLLSNLGSRNQEYSIFYINQKYYDVIGNVSKNRNYMDTDAFIVNNRTMLPLRYLAYALDINVEYDNNTRNAIFTNTRNPILKQETVKVNIDTGIMIDSKGNKYTPDSKPIIKNDRIHASIANVSQLFGATHGKTLVWDGQTQEVRVYKNIK